MRGAKMSQSKHLQFAFSLWLALSVLIGSLNAECCQDGEKKIDEDDCTKYYVCCTGKFVQKSCDRGDWWNWASGVCEKDSGQCSCGETPACTEGELEVNPSDCAAFLECVNGIFVSKSCPAHNYFNVTLNKCLEDTNGVCVGCVEGSTEADSTDCTKYKVCSGGKLVSKSCGSGNYWNAAISKCEKDSGECNGSPSCTEGELEKDPTDCAGYWKCVNGDLVSVKCPDKSYFNVTLKVCTPDTDGVCVGCVEGSTEADSTDCTKYKVCSGGKLVSKSCGSGNYWNAAISKCEKDSGECNGSPSCTEGELEKDPTDCAGYLQCVNGDLVSVKCPDKSYFNVTLKVCTPDTDGVCVGCVEGSTEADSTDCTKYKVCSGGKLVSKSCGSGNYWNAAIGKCEKDSGECNGSPSCTEGELEKDPTDCAGYLQCVNGDLVSLKCADKLYFNVDLKVCTPDTNGVCVGSPSCTEGELKVNPADCAGYLECIHGSLVARKCPDLNYFNATQKKCIRDTDNVCISKVCDPECCDKPNNWIGPVDKNCSAFIQCVYGNKFEQRCPNNLQFNPLTLDCDFPENVNCEDGSAPPSGPNAGPSGTYCESQGRCVGQRDGTMFGDASKTCSSAYVVCQCECEVDFNCSNGLLYNTLFQVCDWPDNVEC